MHKAPSFVRGPCQRRQFKSLGCPHAPAKTLRPLGRTCAAPLSRSRLSNTVLRSYGLCKRWAPIVAITSSAFSTSGSGGDWLEPVEPEALDRDRLMRLLEAADPVEPDLDVALALMDLVRDDLTASGTGGGESLSDLDLRLAIRVPSRVADRAGYEFKLPFRDHTSWRAWWNRNDGYGSWQARRELLGGLFDETYARLIAAQDKALDATLV